MSVAIRNNVTDHPYALQTWDGPYPFLLPGPFEGEAEADVLRIRAPRSYWLYLESQPIEQVEVLRRDLNGSNGLPPLNETFHGRVRKALTSLKKQFLETDWRIKGRFKDESMSISIKRNDFPPGTSMEFPRFITPPPPYGPRPDRASMEDHLPNYQPIDDDYEANEAAAAAAAAAAFQHHANSMFLAGGGGGDGGGGGGGDGFHLNHNHQSHHHHRESSSSSGFTPDIGCESVYSSEQRDRLHPGDASAYSSDTRIKTEFVSSDFSNRLAGASGFAGAASGFAGAASYAAATSGFAASSYAAAASTSRSGGEFAAGIRY